MGFGGVLGLAHSDEPENTACRQPREPREERSDDCCRHLSGFHRYTNKTIEAKIVSPKDMM